MRSLAIARFRFWTTLRSATLIFVFAVLPPVGVLIYEALTPGTAFLHDADALMPEYARLAVIMWLGHACVVAAAAEASGNLKALRPDLTALPSDLMESAPLGPRTRFRGEALGTFAAAATIHACCLVPLAVAASLSPLPVRFFLWLELITILVMVLNSAAAAWKRLAPQNRWSGTRTARSGILFMILALVVFTATTGKEVFRDAVAAFFFSPSPRSWNEVTMGIENPVVLLLLLAGLYVSYLAFYSLAGSRDPARAWETSK